jgi:hypothetical protein
MIKATMLRRQSGSKRHTTRSCALSATGGASAPTAATRRSPIEGSGVGGGDGRSAAHR